ncbi:Pleckstrin homology domain-containing family H member 1 [Schistosoma japonicum]|uniref:Pleckstrin homology domain-containing family H member 1 n=1 Tax=Schistosoma japonicum TaxID=6182 RepID=A0A4Z2DID3_SCHJA|nr:Pleckstrin homology domain-containing family H member 1 [Schistosoma japonicum]
MDKFNKKYATYNEAEQILNKYKSQIIKEGWLKRIKKGQITWLWCRLAGFYLILFIKSSKNTYIHLIGNHASSLERGITKQQNRSYQQFEECEQWRDCLLRASLHSSSKLINSMNIQKSTLSLSLSSSSSPIKYKLLNKLNQSIDQLNIDFNIQIGKQYKESLNEVNAQLTTSFLNKLIIPIININQRQRIDNWWPAIAIWECLCICLTYMLPSEPIIECLQYYTNERKFYTEISSYATFCYDTLKRIKLYGGREQTPSILEIFTISIRNPHTHVYPFSLPIYLPFGSNYEIVNFHDRWTKLSEYATKVRLHNNNNSNNTTNNSNNSNSNDKCKQDHLKKCNYGDERDFATYFACLNYLKHLKCLFPYRFNCSAYIARVHNLSLINENQLIWIIPQDEKINILTGGLFELSSNFELLKTINITELKQISCIKSILFKNIISYGGQQNGIFFLVYVEYANPMNSATTTTTTTPFTATTTTTTATTSGICKQDINHDLHSKQFIMNQMNSNSYSSSSSYHYYPCSSTSSSSRNSINNQQNVVQHLPHYSNKKYKLLRNHSQENMTVKKLTFYLTDLHSVIDLINVLTFLINIQNNSKVT